ncbi:deoxyribodipyrimidine photo-lyase-like [Mya arenaria]|uniref:deoxyribodipyrimidine photo-lyase-like n=1 Tax=Mya arenaria TaxID=6604 RepID=UPI0022E04ED6|nr:deoxyribodipyrimidine photo-lyase-like [Mya arenaria]
MDSEAEIKSILNDYMNGDLSADECFCMVLSLVGYDALKLTFLGHIAWLKSVNTRLYSQLLNVYMGYFESQDDNFRLPDKLDCAVENGFYENDSSEALCGPQYSDGYGDQPEDFEETGYELDLELALKLSLETANNSPSYADIANASSKVDRSVPSNGIVSNIKKHVPPSKATGNATVTVSEVNNKEAENQFHQEDPSAGDGKKKKRNRKKQKNKIEHPLSNPPVIYWFRRDLRVYDNPALVAVSQTGAPVIPVFLWSDTEEGPTSALATGGATKYWLHMALPTLNRDMKDKYNNPIIFRRSSNYLSDMVEIVKTTGAKTIIMNDVYEPFLKERDDKICKELTRKGVKCERYHSYLLHQPGSIRTECLCMRGMGSVTHFMELCRQSSSEPLGFPVDPPGCLPAGSSRPLSHEFNDLQLGKLPRRKDGSMIDWARVIRESWDFSENGAWEALQLFLSDAVKKYEKESSRGDQLNTCRISPYLHFGQISPRTILSEGRHVKSPKFLRKLAWRDLSYWLLSVFPDLPHAPTRPQYQHQRWSGNKAHLKAWQKGYTGYPLVDAAMRQLWLTGWMNNYMRHVVASFLISYLHITWVEGYLWFQDTLLDADVAINAMMWQNGGMSGLDQWNFVMHPVDAAMTCDPKGDYVRKWVPELSNMPEEFVHKPWKCPPSILRRAGVEMGVTYPHRIITDLEEAREQSLRDVVDVRKRFPYLIDQNTGNDLVKLPKGVVIPVITRREFKYKTRNPDSRDNPHNAVLKGYRSRKRDELVDYLNERDFMASTMKECTGRHEKGGNPNNPIVF